jgi:hypothetical protein
MDALAVAHLVDPLGCRIPLAALHRLALPAVLLVSAVRPLVAGAPALAALAALGAHACVRALVARGAGDHAHAQAGRDAPRGAEGERGQAQLDLTVFAPREREGAALKCLHA